jgi:hypothetical protein
LEKAREYFSKMVSLADRSNLQWLRGSALQRVAEVAERAHNIQGAIRLHMDAVAALPPQQKHRSFRSFAALSRLHSRQGNEEASKSFARMARLLSSPEESTKKD